MGNYITIANGKNSDEDSNKVTCTFKRISTIFMSFNASNYIPIIIIHLNALQVD